MTREAIWVEGLPDADNDSAMFRVGGDLLLPFNQETRSAPKVKITKITVQQDLPGLHANMFRVCIWSDDNLMVEMPLHNVSMVGYDKEVK